MKNTQIDISFGPHGIINNNLPQKFFGNNILSSLPVNQPPNNTHRGFILRLTTLVRAKNERKSSGFTSTRKTHYFGLKNVLLFADCLTVEYPNVVFYYRLIEWKLEAYKKKIHLNMNYLC